MSQREISLLPPDGWEQRFIILPGETPWWEIEDREERRAAHSLQALRMYFKEHPEIHWGGNSDRPRPESCELCGRSPKNLSITTGMTAIQGRVYGYVASVTL